MTRRLAFACGPAHRGKAAAVRWCARRRLISAAPFSTTSAASPLPPFDPTDTAAIFRTSSSANLLWTALLFETCGRSWLVDPLKKILSLAIASSEAPPASSLSSPPSPPSSPPSSPSSLGPASVIAGGITWATKRTVFTHFCAGETMEDCTGVAGTMGRASVRVIVDHSKEEAEDEWKFNLDEKIALLGNLRSSLDDAVAFVPVKVTSLADPTMLERVTEVLQMQQQEPQQDEHDEALGELDVVRSRELALARPGPESAEALLAAHLDDETRRLLERAETSLAQLAEAAVAARLALLLDAEQSHRQPAIDYLSLRLMRRFNGGGAHDNGAGAPTHDGAAADAGADADADADAEATPGSPLPLYNTYQLYLADALPRLEAHLQAAEEGGFSLGVKAVRGAYIQSEAERAAAVGKPSPVLPSKAATDAAYDAAVSGILERLASTPATPRAPGDKATATPSPAVVIATHNAASLERAVGAMERLGLARDDRRVHLAQIMGMCDNLTFALGQSGYNAHKLVLFGAFADVMPWMIRRLDENSDMLGATASQKGLLWSELRRRAGLGGGGGGGGGGGVRGLGGAGP